MTSLQKNQFLKLLPSESEKCHFQSVGLPGVTLDLPDGRNHGHVDSDDPVRGVIKHLFGTVVVQLERQLWLELVLLPGPVRHGPISVPHDVLFDPFLTAKKVSNQYFFNCHKIFKIL